MFGLREHAEWRFLAFLIVLLQPVVLYLLAALVLAGWSGDRPVDLRANYHGHSPWFFGLAVLLLLVSLAKDLALDGELPEGLNLAVHLVLLGLWTVAAVARRSWLPRGSRAG